MGDGFELSKANTQLQLIWVPMHRQKDSCLPFGADGCCKVVKLVTASLLACLAASLCAIFVPQFLTGVVFPWLAQLFFQHRGTEFMRRETKPFLGESDILQLSSAF